MIFLISRGYLWKASPQLRENHFTTRYGQSLSPELRRAMGYPVLHWEKFVASIRYFCRRVGTGQKSTPDIHRRKFRFLSPGNLKITPYLLVDHALTTPIILMPRGRKP